MTDEDTENEPLCMDQGSWNDLVRDLRDEIDTLEHGLAEARVMASAAEARQSKAMTALVMEDIERTRAIHTILATRADSATRRSRACSIISNARMKLGEDLGGASVTDLLLVNMPELSTVDEARDLTRAIGEEGRNE